MVGSSMRAGKCMATLMRRGVVPSPLTTVLRTRSGAELPLGSLPPPTPLIGSGSSSGIATTSSRRSPSPVDRPRAAAGAGPRLRAPRRGPCLIDRSGVAARAGPPPRATGEGLCVA
ncbi:unnamed protein product [Sphagnum balticum]